MNGKHYVGKHAKSITVGARLEPITGVILNGDNENVFIAGDESGQVLETFVPTATQKMAEDILRRVRGFEYQGYNATNAFIPPTAELGDGITLAGTYGVLASREYSFTPKLTETIGAPYNNEEDHEYQYTGTVAKEMGNTVQQGKLYYGTRITYKNGLEIVKTDGNITKSHVILNSDQLVFLNDDGREAFYYDSKTGVFRLTQYANIDGALDGSQIFSQLEQTVDGFKTTVSGLGGRVSQLEQTVDGFYLSVSNGISSSTISLMSGSAEISSQTIKFTGVVTFTDLSTPGATTISGNNITTGTIDAINITSCNITGGTINGAQFRNAAGNAALELGTSSGGYGDMRLMGRNSSSGNYWNVFEIRDEIQTVTLWGYNYEFLRISQSFGAYPRGNWNFSGATVTGLSAVAVFG